tara:strand:+ start:261 stop:467 length:207 start_codon:yes stop_codon:yes gene_type:complete
MNIIEFILQGIWIIAVIFIVIKYIKYLCTPNQNKELFTNMNKLKNNKWVSGRSENDPVTLWNKRKRIK